MVITRQRNIQNSHCQSERIILEMIVIARHATVNRSDGNPRVESGGETPHTAVTRHMQRTVRLAAAGENDDAGRGKHGGR
ncbi:hypothetical protein K0M31_012238 [Melipona bicolor]|uniref:Uncharacterized protein n=1 Tax=Melipona bicolor TaxID=60889 RepID=A0AA40FKJ5_9HYME|nr:hypothetical protein K0M31_012238 [Melipona bicolor]